MMTILDYLIEQNIEVGSLVFDGLMIYSVSRKKEIIMFFL